ncbi:hypothetical protein Tco_0627019 [Tanacetum coccineum]|uniref:Uncharacterized protein n=1 Tax=Tanacetum coccineum TaxID=301880 RepID=A0ABQ4WL60_9ASTR
MLRKKPNKVYDSFLKAGLGNTNPMHLNKAIATQPKMYDGGLIHSNKLVIHSTDSEENLEDAEESQNKMRYKMVQIDYENLNALYETFVPQQKLSAEQTYFSIPSTSDNGSKSKDVPSESPSPKMPNESRSQAQSIAFELKLQHQKEKMACDVSWKAKLSTLHDENVLLKHQVESTVKERENIKLEFQRLFNSIKATRAQHQNEINEMIENVNQKTYDYADVRAQNQDLLMTISELRTLGQLLCVTPFNKNPTIKAKNVSNTKVTSDRPNPVTSQSTSIIERKQQHNANVIERGVYKLNQQDTNTPDSKVNINVSNSTGVGSSNSVRRPKSKDNKSKNSVLKNTKSSSTYVWKTTNSVCLYSNKCETKPLNVCHTNACITNSKTVTTVNDGLNILCISYGLDVFLHSHDKCVVRNALTRKSSVKRALFTSPVAAKSKGLGATSVVAKSRFNVAKTPTATNKVSSVSPLSPKSSQSRILRSYMNNKIATSRKRQKWFEYKQGMDKAKITRKRANTDTGNGRVQKKPGIKKPKDKLSSNVPHWSISQRNGTLVDKKAHGMNEFVLYLLSKEAQSRLTHGCHRLIGAWEALKGLEVFHTAQHVIPGAQLVPQYKSIGRCNNYAVLQSIPCSPEYTEDTIKFLLDTQQFIYAMDMFRDTLHLPVETPDTPFVTPANIHKNQCRELKHQIEEAVKSGQLVHLVKGVKKKEKASHEMHYSKTFIKFLNR